jgi:hypothetical protein
MEHHYKIAVELVVQEAWQESLLPREEETNGEVDNGPPLDNWEPPDDGIVLLDWFGGIGSGFTSRDQDLVLRLL